MISIRTELPSYISKEFKQFLVSRGLDNILVGRYNTRDNLLTSIDYICYAYSNKTISAEMTSLVLTYGSIENAFKEIYAKENNTH